VFDLGIDRKLWIKTDAKVAKSITGRRGTGSIRHLEVSQLWVQDRFLRGDFEVEKVDGEVNRADQLTKYKDAMAIDRTAQWTSGEIRQDRHPAMPVLSIAMASLYFVNWSALFTSPSTFSTSKSPLRNRSCTHN
jgi:hypothetical protein